MIAAEESGVERLGQRLQDARLYVDEPAALEAQRRRGQFNAIDPSSGWKACFIVQEDRACSRTEFERRDRVFLLGIEVRKDGD